MLKISVISYRVFIEALSSCSGTKLKIMLVIRTIEILLRVIV